MYEVWLALNIVWEIILGILPLLLVAALVWIVLLVLAVRRPWARWRAAVPTVLAVSVAVAVAAFLLVPATVQSSLAELGYWVDWVNLLAIAAGFGALAAAFAWPLAALSGKPHTPAIR